MVGEVCCRRWRAPRHDAPRSVDVHHVCARLVGHPDYCICSCGAEATPEPPMCDYRHADGAEALAEWVLIGEAGDYYVCAEHFAMRTEEGRRGWHRVWPER